MSNIQQISIRLKSFIRDLHAVKKKRNIAKEIFQNLENMQELEFITNLETQFEEINNGNLNVAATFQNMLEEKNSEVLKAMEEYFNKEREVQSMYNTIRTVTSNLQKLQEIQRTMPGKPANLLEFSSYSHLLGGKKKTKKRKTLKKKLKKKSYKKNKKYKYNKRKQTIKKN